MSRPLALIAERINAINAHFITAFLDRYVKGDEPRAAYLTYRWQNLRTACGRLPVRRRRMMPTAPVRLASACGRAFSAITPKVWSCCGRRQCRPAAADESLIHAEHSVTAMAHGAGIVVPAARYGALGCKA